MIIIDTIGKTVIGNYLGTSEVSHEKYLEDYKMFNSLHANDTSIPRIGDTVEVHKLNFNTTEKCLFVGLKIDTVLLNRLNNKEAFYITNSSRDRTVYYNKKRFLIDNYQGLPF